MDLALKARPVGATEVALYVYLVAQWYPLLFFLVLGSLIK